MSVVLVQVHPDHPQLGHQPLSSADAGAVGPGPAPQRQGQSLETVARQSGKSDIILLVGTYFSRIGPDLFFIAGYLSGMLCRIPIDRYPAVSCRISCPALFLKLNILVESDASALQHSGRESGGTH